MAIEKKSVVIVNLRRETLTTVFTTFSQNIGCIKVRKLYKYHHWREQVRLYLKNCVRKRIP